MNKAIENMAGDIKQGLGVAVATTGSGAGTWLDILPTLLGLFATILGICLSCVLIYVNIQRNKREKEIYEEQLKQIRKRRTDPYES